MQRGIKVKDEYSGMCRITPVDRGTVITAKSASGGRGRGLGERRRRKSHLGQRESCEEGGATKTHRWGGIS